MSRKDGSFNAAQRLRMIEDVCPVYLRGLSKLTLASVALR